MSVCTIVNKYSPEHSHYCPIKASRFDELGTYMRARNAESLNNLSMLYSYLFRQAHKDGLLCSLSIMCLVCSAN